MFPGPPVGWFTVLLHSRSNTCTSGSLRRGTWMVMVNVFPSEDTPISCVSKSLPTDLVRHLQCALSDRCAEAVMSSTTAPTFA